MPSKGYAQSPSHRQKISKSRGGNPPANIGKSTFLSQTTVRKKAGGRVGDNKVAAHPDKKGITAGKPTPQWQVRAISHATHERETKRAKKR